MENGLPQNTVQALAQTKDGFLWLGTEAGLVRFDGVEFQTYDHKSNPALPGNDIRCLLASADGALWIGANAGLARWKDGAVTVFTAQDGLRGTEFWRWKKLPDGRLMVSTDSGVAELSGDRFVAVTVEEFLADRGRRPRPGSKAKAVLPKDAIEYSAQINGGQFAIGSKSTVLVFRNEIVAARLTIGAEISGSRIQTIFADREGALWIGTNAGLVRWVNGKVERFPETDPLATASILALMEDYEGDLWIGTETGGMDVLRDQRFRTIDVRDGLNSDRITTVVEDADGTLWAGTQEDGLNTLSRDEATDSWRVARSFSVKNGLASNVILSLAAAPNDDLWVGTPDGLSRIRGDQVETFSSADGLPDDFIRSLLIDADGSLWIGTRRGLTHWAVGKSGPGSGGAMKTYTHASGLGSDLVGAMARDKNGDLWIATLAGLSRLHGNTISNFTIADGLSSNVVTALLARADGTLLIGTENHGWDKWDGSKFSRVAHNGLEQATIYAILDDGSGHLWFTTGDGIARGDCSEMGGASAAMSCSQWMEFGDCRWAAQPGDGDEQPPVGVAIAQRPLVVCYCQRAGGVGPGAFSSERTSASGCSGEASGGRCDAAVAWSGLSIESCGGPRSF
ncbi:MAG: two-component regulator propeller domain-containing protein [Terracidiphilus sp.]